MKFGYMLVEFARILFVIIHIYSLDFITIYDPYQKAVAPQFMFLVGLPQVFVSDFKPEFSVVILKLLF